MINLGGATVESSAVMAQLHDEFALEAAKAGVAELIYPGITTEIFLLKWLAKFPRGLSSDLGGSKEQPNTKLRARRHTTRNLASAAKTIESAADELEKADYRKVASRLARILAGLNLDTTHRNNLMMVARVLDRPDLSNVLRPVATVYRAVAKLYKARGLELAAVEQHVRRLPLLLHVLMDDGEPNFESAAKFAKRRLSQKARIELDKSSKIPLNYLKTAADLFPISDKAMKNSWEESKRYLKTREYLSDLMKRLD